jgi:hypothetical protein
MLDLENIASLDPGRWSLRPHRWKPGITGVTRRRFLQASAITAAAAASLAVFQKPALAVGSYPASYSIRPDCGGITSYPDNGGCNTTDRIIGGCCTSPETACPAGVGYHKHSHPQNYDMRPDKCINSSGQHEGRDGWLWKITYCLDLGSECRKNRQWRCHDGRINGAASICRWVVSSGTTCSPC